MRRVKSEFSLLARGGTKVSIYLRENSFDVFEDFVIG